MDTSWLAELVVQLYASIQMLSGYPVPESMPKVELLAQSEIQRMVCRGPCQIRAFYHPDIGVVMDESFNLKSNTHHRSILLHELVHHAQHVAGAFENLPSTCRARSESESEAYEVQNRFLAQQRATENIPVPRWDMLCDAPPATEENKIKSTEMQTAARTCNLLRPTKNIVWPGHTFLIQEA